MAVDLQLEAQIVAAQAGTTVKHVLRDTAATDGNTVFLPASEEDRDVLLMFMAHEAPGHIRHTDMALYSSAVTGASPLEEGLHNIIEDIRIEKAAWLIFPGCKRILNTGVVRLLERDFFRLHQQPNGPEDVIFRYFLVGLRFEELKQPFNDFIDQVRADAYSILGEVFAKDLLDIARNGANGSQTDVHAAAKRIIGLLRQECEDQDSHDSGDQNQDQQDGQGNGQGQGNDQNQDQQDGQGNGQGQGDDQNQSQQDGQGNGQCQGNGQNQGQQDGQGNGQGQGDAQSQDQLEGQGNGQGRADAAAILQALEALSVDSVSDLGDAMKEMISALPSIRGNTVDRVDLTATPLISNASSISPLARRLSAKLEQLLQSKLETARTTTTSGRLDCRKLARVGVDDPEVFYRKGKDAEGLDTAVSILVDISGSMDGHPILVAKDAAISIGDALNRFCSQGVEFSLHAFNDRLFDLAMFGQKWKKNRGNQGYLVASGNTHFIPAARNLLTPLALRREKRKVLFVITDGDIGTAEESLALTQSCSAYGIELRGIFIDDAATKNQALSSGWVAAHAVSSSEPESLLNAIFETLKESF